MSWLPAGKKAAICLSIDDVHPSTSRDSYEAGGDLGDGALGFVERLLACHSELKVTIFVTPDWRPIQLVSSRPIAKLPLLSELVYHVDLVPRERFRLDRHPNFVRYLNELPRTDVAPHGLHHVHRGRKLAVEFQGQSRAECRRILRRTVEHFRSAGLDYVNGFAPPGWHLPNALIDALDEHNFAFVCSARDLNMPIARDARNGMSGLKGVSLLYPEKIGNRSLVHIPTNFQATSTIERAEQVIACNGVLSIKAHIFKQGGGYTLKDGLDEDYLARLHTLFEHLERRHGDSLWWTSMNELARRWLESEFTGGSRAMLTRA